MRTVYKQLLKYTDQPQTFTLVGFEEVIHVDLQNSNVAVWYLADPESTFHDSRTFQIFGTGDPTIPDDAVHLGSVLQEFWVWHVFEMQVPDEDA